jgi:hypothetical protein
LIPRSAALLKSLLAREQQAASDVAASLGCPVAEMRAFAAGEPVMPLPLQLRLAEFVISHVPALARRGHALKAQVSAATSFHDHDTSVHAEPPGRWTTRRR